MFGRNQIFMGSSGRIWLYRDKKKVDFTARFNDLKKKPHISVEREFFFSISPVIPLRSSRHTPV